MFPFLRKWRRRKLFKKPFPSEWVSTLKTNVRQYMNLSETQQRAVQSCVQVMAHEKYWEGAAGLVVNDEIKVTIAGSAGLLLLGLDTPYFYDHLRTIIVYPGSIANRHRAFQSGEVVDPDEVYSGQAWQGGPLIFSWHDVLQGSRNHRDGHNVVIHEFAHHIDGLDGDMGGMPPIADRVLAERWQTTMRQHYDAFVELVATSRRTPLDPYAATSPAEFFAVVSEQFFERPDKLNKTYPQVYELMTAFFKIDPASWVSRDR